MPKKTEKKTGTKKVKKAKKAVTAKAKEAKKTKKAVKKETVKVTAKKEEKKTAKKKPSVKVHETMVPTDDYLSTGIHIGTKQKTKFMDKYVYKVRHDGLSILNVELIDKKIREVSEFINRFEPDEILIVSNRDTGIKPIKLLNKATGIRISTGRYLPGTLTNPNYKEFFEPKVVMVTDVWYDQIVIQDALKTGAVVIALVNTNNNSSNVDLVIPCNNKGKKSVSLIYWILAREYAKAHKTKFEFKMEDFF